MTTAVQKYRATPKGRAAMARCRKAKTRILKEFIRTMRAVVPCADCGLGGPWYVKEFDHTRGTKRYNIGVMCSSWASVLQEIRKCDVVCANCHRTRTHKRRGC